MLVTGTVAAYTGCANNRTTIESAAKVNNNSPLCFIVVCLCESAVNITSPCVLPYPHSILLFNTQGEFCVYPGNVRHAEYLQE